MEFKKHHLVISIVIVLALILGYVGIKYTRYRSFLISIQTLPNELKLAEFYAKFARFPEEAKEYLDFVKSDSIYYAKIARTGCYLQYDSVKERIVLYSPGFDGDDDYLQTIYNPNEVDFATSLSKDGDVFCKLKA